MSTDTHINRRKQSIVAGGLISSAGIFLAKFLGLFYAVPYNTIMGSEVNVAVYGAAYNIYSYVLNICIAGFPFAIATMVAKYTTRNDYQTALLVKQLSSRLMIGFGLVAMLFLMAFAGPLAPYIMPDVVSEAAIETNLIFMRNTLMIVSVALFLVPVLSSIRGFYQGLKQMEIYALSQVLEQLARIIFLLVTSALAVYFFNMDRMWAVYFGAISTVVATILAIVHIKFYDHKQMKEIRRLAKEQEVVPNNDKMSIVRELIFISFPYLISSVLGYSDAIINTFFVKSGLELFYMNNGGGELIDGVNVLAPAFKQEVLVIYGAINYGVLKLMSIPMILAPGFSSAIIPHITSALEQKNYKLVRKNIRDCVDIVLYIGVPLTFCLFAFAKPLYSTLFYPGSDEALDLCAQVLRWYSIEAFLSTIGPIFTSLMMAVGMRKQNIWFLAVTVAIKVSITYPMIVFFGYPGLVISSVVSMGLYVGIDGYILYKRYRVNWGNTLRKLCVIVLGLVVIFVVSIGCNMIGLKGYGEGRMIGFVQLAISGFLAMLAYCAVTYAFGIPQALFHFDLKMIMNKVKRK